MNRIESKMEQGNLKRQLRELWPEVQKYTGLKYSFDRRVIVQVRAKEAESNLLLISFVGIIVSAVALIVAMDREYSAMAIICFLIVVVFAVLLIATLWRSDETLPNKLWTLSYPCQRTNFLRERLRSVHEWQKGVRPDMEKVLRLKPIIEDELGSKLMVFCLDELDDFYVACDLLDDGKQVYYAPETICNDLIAAIIEEREIQERAKQREEAREQAIEDFKKDLNW